MGILLGILLGTLSDILLGTPLGSPFGHPFGHPFEHLLGTLFRVPFWAPFLVPFWATFRKSAPKGIVFLRFISFLNNFLPFRKTWFSLGNNALCETAISEVSNLCRLLVVVACWLLLFLVVGCLLAVVAYWLRLLLVVVVHGLVCYVGCVKLFA